MTRQPMPPDPQLIEKYEAQQLEQAITGVTPLSHDGRKNRVRMKNQILNIGRAVEQSLGQRAASDLRRRLDEVAEDLRLIQRPASWCVLTDGSDYESLVVPMPFPEHVVVDTRYYVRPLIQALAVHAEFLVLALSQGDVRLYRVSGEQMTEQQVDALPGSLTEVVGQEVDSQSLHHHVAGGAIFNAQGKGHDDRDPELERFIAAVDHAITDDPHLRQEHLMLATVEELDALYRQLSNHRGLMSVPIRLSPDQTRPEELRRAALEAFSQWRAADNCAAFAALQEDAHHTSDIELIVRASIEGRVDTLMVDQDRSLWGRFDPDTWEVSLHDQREPHSRDLIDTALRATWRQSGNVRTLDGEQRDSLGMDSLLLARLRY